MVNRNDDFLICELSHDQSILDVAAQEKVGRNYLDKLLKTALPEIFSDSVQLWNASSGNLGGTFYKFFPDIKVVAEYNVHFSSKEGKRIDTRLTDAILSGKERMPVDDGDGGFDPDQPQYVPLRDRVHEISDVCIRAELCKLGTAEIQTNGRFGRFSFDRTIENIPAYEGQETPLRYVIESMLQGKSVQEIVQMDILKEPMIVRFCGYGSPKLSVSNPLLENVEKGAEYFSRLNGYLKEQESTILNSVLLVMNALRLEGPKRAFKRMESQSEQFKGISQRFENSTECLNMCAEQIYVKANEIISRLDPPRDGLNYLSE